jgi:hypothetical protein
LRPERRPVPPQLRIYPFVDLRADPLDQPFGHRVVVAGA